MLVMSDLVNLLVRADIRYMDDRSQIDHLTGIVRDLIDVLHVADESRSPLWCFDERFHAEHWENPNFSDRGNYCSGRPARMSNRIEGES